MYLPNYKGYSIVNLMSSIGGASGWKSPYSPLKNLSPKELKKYKNIVLIVIDGLGYEYLINQKQSFLKDHLRSKMTSVALPTTASAITTFATGLAPQQHAYTGWFMFLKELGIITTILPFSPRVGGKQLDEYGIETKDILKTKAFSERINRKAVVISHKDIARSNFSLAVSKKSKIITYNDNISTFFKQLKNSLKFNGRKFIYAYWPRFDGLAHKYGIESKKVNKHFNELDKKFKTFFKRLKTKNTLFIITADHGLITTPIKDRIMLDKHQKLKECLTMPPCGEGRTPYCYVHPSKSKDFERYVKAKLKKYCDMYKSKDLIKRNFFGLGPANPMLADRLGDYVLIMKKNYILKTINLGEKDNKHMGHHGGFSKEELFVPLIIVKT